jgi:SNF2 family DNA or RNA helicase
MYDLIDNSFTERDVADAVEDLFSQDGHIYLVAGYFNKSGYFQMKSSIKEFLGRDEENKVTVVVGTNPDQFSATIAYDLWDLDERGQVDLLKYEQKFVHTKHYVRDNSSPSVILGSANFTREGLQEHLELVSCYETDNKEDSIYQQHINWFENIVEQCEEVTEDDLEEFKQERIEIELLENKEVLDKLDIQLKDIKDKLQNPDSFPEYRTNLLSHYLEVDDTRSGSIAIKSRIKKLPHQIVAASQAYENLSYNGFYLLADEVGLGKTYEAGMAYKQLKFAGKVDRTLILCNASAMKDWDNALQQFYEDPTRITSSRKAEWKKQGFSERDIWMKDDLMIATPQMFRIAAEKELVSPEDFDMLVLDEAHIVKNKDSKTHNIIKDFDVKYKLFLTATPVQNREKEFYNLFDCMEENFLGSSYKSFKKQGENYIRDMLQGEKESFLTRHLREDLPYMKIPPRDVKDRFVNLSKEERRVYSTFMAFLSDLVERNEDSAPQFVSVTYQKIAASSWFSLEASMKKLREKQKEDTGESDLSLSEFEEAAYGEKAALTDENEELEVDLGMLDTVIEELEKLNAEAKVKEAKDALEEILEDENKVVIFSQYKKNILEKSRIGYDINGDNLLKALRESDRIDVPIYTYHGDMNTTERYETRENFDETGGIFLTTEAGAESINLQHCSVLMNFDIPWNPARLEQRIGRIQRLGQEKEVLIFNLVMNRTLDESVYEKIVQKHNLLQQKFGSSEEVTQEEALKAVESGSIKEIESTSSLFMEALKNRKDAEEIQEYFEESLEQRQEEMNRLGERMEDNLETFDDRIKVLLSGESSDTEEVEEKIEHLKDEYKATVEEYLRYLHFTTNISLEFHEEDQTVTLRGNKQVLGDNKVKAALDGESSLFTDLPLLTPSAEPLKGMLNETKKDFSITAVQEGDGVVFDFLLEVNSPLNRTQEVVRVKVHSRRDEVGRDYLKDASKNDDVNIEPVEFLSKLGKAYEKAEDKAEEQMEDEKEEIKSFVTSELSRLRKKETERRNERIKQEVQQPIQLQKDKVDSMKKKFENGEITAKKLENGKKELKKRKNNKNHKRRSIRREVKEEFSGKINEVKQKKGDIDYDLELKSAVLMS